MTRVVSFASAKGSPGCTFLAVGLAGCLAAGGVSTLLVDADAEEQGTAAYLDLPLGAGSLRAGAARLGLDPGALRDASLEVASSLRCLRATEVEEVAGADLVEGARTVAEAVVVDLGHRAERLQRDVAAASDWLVWVVVPDRLGLERADRALRRGELRAASDGVVLNRLGRGCLKGAAALLSERHRLPVLARLPDDRPSAQPGRSLHARRPFRRGFGELARCLHPGYPPVRGVWP